MPRPSALGQIVWATSADANGIRKLRPAVIVTPTERLSPEGPWDVVAVSSRLAEPLPEDHVLLPWHPRGHPRTGLKQRCAAICTWLARITESDIQGLGGMVPGPLLITILAKIAAALPPPPGPPTPGKPPTDGTSSAPAGT